MCESFDWNSRGSSESEVSELENVLFVDEQVLRLEVTMEDLPFMAVSDAFQQLIGKTLHDARVKTLLLAETVHVLLEVVVEKFEDKDELAISVDDLSERNDVRVCKLLEDGDLSDGG